MKDVTNKQGITLIALVITIVILVILAAITIHLIFNDNIINRAEKLTNDTDNIVQNTTGKLTDLIADLNGERNIKIYFSYYGSDEKVILGEHTTISIYDSEESTNCLQQVEINKAEYEKNGYYEFKTNLEPRTYYFYLWNYNFKRL